MKKVAFIVLVLVMMLALAVTVFAAPPEHLVTGGGTLDIGLDRIERYAFSARIDIDGNVSGKFWSDWASPDVTLRGDITCLSVSGNEAKIALVVTQTDDPDIQPVGSGLVFSVVDNGEGVGNSFDQISIFEDDEDPTTCNDNFDTYYDLVAGNIRVN